MGWRVLAETLPLHVGLNYGWLHPLEYIYTTVRYWEIHIGLIEVDLSGSSWLLILVYLTNSSQYTNSAIATGTHNKANRHSSYLAWSSKAPFEARLLFSQAPISTSAQWSVDQSWYVLPKVVITTCLCITGPPSKSREFNIPYQSSHLT